jgi:methionyl-tRNA formyltransferase
MTTPTIVIATPHSRNDLLEQRVRGRLPNYRLVRLRDRRELAVELLAQIRPDFVFFPHWSWLIPEDVHSHFNCVIFHMTDVPYGRGGSPLQNLIIRGHRTTKLTALKCVSGLDAGPVYLKYPLSLEGTAEEILRRASALIEEMIVEIVENRPIPVPQQGEVVEFKRRRPADGNMASLEKLEQVFDFIRMLDADGYPPAFLKTVHLRLEFNEARLGEGFVEAKVRISKESHG